VALEQGDDVGLARGRLGDLRHEPDATAATSV
jgi:hypothetical protein